MSGQCQIGEIYSTIKGETIVIYTKDLMGWYRGMKVVYNLNNRHYCLDTIYVINRNGYDSQGNQVIVFS